jgi:thioredoxin 1
VEKMKSITKAAIVAALVAVILVVGLKRSRPTTDATPAESTWHEAGRAYRDALGRRTTDATPAESTAATTGTKKGLPRLVDLGAKKCIPCKMMAPVLDELKAEYGASLRVDVIDVWENPNAGYQYGIRVIPTQIFYDSADKELFRHEGFMSKEDIVAKWQELGISLGPSP